MALGCVCRFVFEGMSGEKIDAFVDYPVEQLDMSQYVVEDDRQQNLVYDLISCVCHSGGLLCGVQECCWCELV